MMSVDLHVVRRCLAGRMVLVGAIGADTSAVAQRVTVDEAVRSVRGMLERLPKRATPARPVPDGA